MTSVRLLGLMSRALGSLEIDAGTMCRSQSSMPGVVGIMPSKKVQVTSHRPAVVVKGAGSLTSENFKAAAEVLGADIDARLVRAFADVESGGRSGLGPAGLPMIAFEGHWFRNLTKKKFDKEYPLLSYPYVRKAGPEWQKNNVDQATAWNTLNSAIELDKSAAQQSCSWGMFQVMGFNYKVCGYATVAEFVSAMNSESGQLDAFVRYCKKKQGVVAAMRDKDYAKLAELYNGDDYGDYDRRIEKAYKRHGGI